MAVPWPCPVWNQFSMDHNWQGRSDRWFNNWTRHPDTRQSGWSGKPIASRLSVTGYIDGCPVRLYQFTGLDREGAWLYSGHSHAAAVTGTALLAALCLTCNETHSVQHHVLLKELSLDVGDLKSCQPACNLTFNLQIISCQLVCVRCYHSTVSALQVLQVQVLTDIHCTANCLHITLLSLLDLSGPFDSVGHEILV